ncbi:MAG: type I methionyl aminopeptidase [Bowdeniella nasicola]|nr:type I methionyl aminopeptidase [Bowdeniella nasicola]
MFGPKPEIKTRAQLAAMAEAGAITYAMLEACERVADVGVSTAEIDAVAEAVCREAGGRPNFKGYQGFPATVCISVNDEIVHGIPSPDRVLADGDVVSVDGGCTVSGPGNRRWHSDSARTFIVGEPRPVDVELVEVTLESMWRGIAALAGASRVGVVGRAVEAVVSQRPVDGRELGIVEEFVGHGIGSTLHQPPDVRNFVTRDRGARLRSGMALCVEPLLTLGEPDNDTLDDGWTVCTLDGSRAAHFEHTVALWEGGLRILTLPDGGAAELAALGVPLADLNA